MKHYYLVVMLLCLPLAYATDIELVGGDFAGSTATVRLGDSERMFVVSPTNELSIGSVEGPVRIQVTKGGLYVGRADLSTTRQVFLSPVATLSGSVLDTRDNLLQHKRLQAVCSSGIYGAVPEMTDDFGFFKIEDIPVGTCTITAIHEGRAYRSTIDLTENKHYTVHILVDDSLPTSDLSIILFFIALFVFILGVYFWIYRQRTKTPTKRQADLLDTLTDRERQIMLLLFYEGLLTQSQLRHKSSLPKSTLHRTINVLVRKNLVREVSDSGVVKYVLTELFCKKGILKNS